MNFVIRHNSFYFYFLVYKSGCLETENNLLDRHALQTLI